MCGIVGAMSAWLGNAEKERVKELLTVSNLRGFQGAGTIVTDNKGDVTTFKTTDTGTHLAHDPAFNERLYHTKPLQNVACIIGHTRWPTKGAVTLEATHPHEFEHIVGVHNGTIDEINGKYIGKDQSDSFELFKSFAINGVRETIQKTRGDYCLVWVDMEAKTINFLRNEKRPLYLAVMKTGGVMYWASERGMLDFVLGRQQGQNTGQFEVLNLLPNKWSQYKFPLKHGLGHDGIEELHGMAAPEVAAFAPFLGTNWTGRHSRVGSGTSTPIAEAKEGGAAEGGVTTGTTNPSGKPTVVPMLPKPQTQSTWMPGGADKPKLKWCDTALTWVPAEPDPVTTTALVTPSQPPLSLVPEVSSTPKTQTPTSHGGSQTKSNVERKESQSTEGNFRGDVLRDDGQVGGEEAITPERDFSQGPQNISEVMQELFNESNTLYPGYRMTIEDNWMDQEYYIKCLQDGCLWCGDPQPDVPTNLWTDVEEFMCIECQGEEFARDYIKITLGIKDDEIPVPLKKSA
jgi:hypothetical protein